MSDVTQDERRAWLIAWLLAERPEYADMQVPEDEEGQRQLLRALMNVRAPLPVTDEFLAVQDAYLAERLSERGVTALDSLAPVGDEGVDAQLYLWRGDITTLAVDAIVNAANDQMLGCFVPGHHCIDNAIHTFAGVQLRLACAEVMARRGRPEPTATATVTPAFNLPARLVVHTVGPIVAGRRPSPRDELLLRRCYRSCLEAASDAGCASLAFCCISTGVFGYPQEAAARVAVHEVRRWLVETGSALRVVFDVFGPQDEGIYRRVLQVAR
jgi:O-acetyl-ADP-ribose deacetylase (regulator of RNase III)